MKHIFDEIEKINAGQNFYNIKTSPISKKIFLRPIAKAQTFLNNKFPIEFQEFYSSTIDLDFHLIGPRDRLGYEPGLVKIVWLKRMFDDFKKNPEPLTEEQENFIKVKASYPFSKCFPYEFYDYQLFNEVTRQKLFIDIEGTGNAIFVDFYTQNEKGYALKFFAVRNPEHISEINLTLTEFLNYFIYFGITDYWFFAFINNDFCSLTDIDQIKKDFGKLSTHKQKIEELERLIKV